MRVAVIGAGAAGAGAAWVLRNDAEVTILEKRDMVGGRAATRRRGPYTYDYGANYVKGGDERVASLVRQFDVGLIDIGKPIWTFDAEGNVSKAAERDDHMWTWQTGIATLCQRLIDTAGATVMTETPVRSINRTGRRWEVIADGNTVGPFEAVVMTPPAPRTARILRQSDWGDEQGSTGKVRPAGDAEERQCNSAQAVRRPVGPPLGERLGNELDDVPYRPIFSAVLGYESTTDRPWYALVNTDRRHAVSWVSREECKPGHVPEGESVLVAQMAPEWSGEWADEPERDACRAAAGHVADLLGDSTFTDPDWTDGYRWKYALADGAVPRESTEVAREYDVFFAGDWIAGDGRVHLALRSGLTAGEHLLTSAR